MNTNESDWTEADAACRQVIVAFAYFIDHRQFDQAADLFTEDGTWNRHGDDLRGRAQIRSVLESKPGDQLERHVFTNIHLDHHSPTTCSAVSYVQIFRGTAAVDNTVPAPSSCALGEFHDELVRTADGWKFDYKTATPVFKLL